MFKKCARKGGLLCALALSLVAFGDAQAAMDLTAATTAITAAVTDVETVAVAIIAAAAVLFGISKIRQVIKA